RWWRRCRWRGRQRRCGWPWRHYLRQERFVWHRGLRRQPRAARLSGTRSERALS
ncbi:hypothetical protein TMDG_00042, partial [Mycobacterium tuberculosis SUMu004]